MRQTGNYREEGGGFACNDGMYSGFLHVPTKHLSSEVTEKTK